jgi:hypothetical protein
VPLYEETKRIACKGRQVPLLSKITGKEISSIRFRIRKKTSGSCPFMGGSEKKKSIPQLNLIRPFVSKFKYYLSPNRLKFYKKGEIACRHRQISHLLAA